MSTEMLLGISIWFVPEMWQTAEFEGMKNMESNLCSGQGSLEQVLSLLSHWGLDSLLMHVLIIYN